MKIQDREILKHYIAARGYSYGRLAAEIGCSKATIGHLVTGHITTTRDTWARKLEEVLAAPTGSLFVPKVSRVSEDTAA